MWQASRASYAEMFLKVLHAMLGRGWVTLVSLKTLGSSVDLCENAIIATKSNRAKRQLHAGKPSTIAAAAFVGQCTLSFTAAALSYVLLCCPSRSLLLAWFWHP
jgi:hypothetical protein